MKQQSRSAVSVLAEGKDWAYTSLNLMEAAVVVERACLATSE